MKVDVTNESLPIFEALSSKVRIQIIQILAKQSMNITALAESVGLSTAIMTMHIKKLERGGIIRTKMVPGKAGVQKICELGVDKIEVLFPQKYLASRDYQETSLSVGHYTDFSVEPTCGLATPEKIIGEFDEPRYFLDQERVNAKILWFGKGYIEYKVPNFLHSKYIPEELEISMEISSEAPFTNDNWPSDITFYLNDIELGKWTSPGDFGDNRGKYTPSWWPGIVNQYGLLKRLRVTNEGTYMDGNWLSDVTIEDIKIREKQWTFRIAVHDEEVHVGGVTLFGKGFGNYDQDILFRLYYKTEVTSGREAEPVAD
ncbi:helix-turn-helix domain-containing protein [Pullulanibacillus sp. KACC 23026]|uniref:ArsR/SmtB family transcription factor n=1 Tax=Pullulanibacillus sp. KACC 23026 TaxID=3028315 RepID=UPI0023AF8879|nr:helix-turn-helix domain-containing protein [Pullulanibacillus sp. KACC 23026]WEG11091.1 helix-turn-helix domain-containing protein [Pullulanibacillus sp. KACC 23026]